MLCKVNVTTNQMIHKDIDRLQVSGDEFKALQQSTDVEIAEVDGVVLQSTDIYPGNARVIGKNVMHQKGLTGKGIKVSILDTRISTSNTDLAVRDGVSFVYGVSSYEDDHDNGTVMASIMAALKNDRGMIGVALDIELYSVSSKTIFTII